jgi:protein gp37
MSATAIEWTDATWNPVTGCSKVSPGCAHCYAEAVTELRAGRPGFIDEHRPWTPANAEHNVRLWPARLDQPLRWTRPRMVFVNSMSDLFHEQIPFEYIAAVFGVMGAADEHTFQVLTKRPARMHEFFCWYAGECREHELRADERPWLGIYHAREHGVGGLELGDGCGYDWPLSNVWLGVSIENRRFVDRADTLRETPAAVRFVSAEPLLGPLIHDGIEGTPRDIAHGHGSRCWHDGKDGEELDLTNIDWLIVGGESGPDHRPTSEEWVRGLRDAALSTRWTLIGGEKAPPSEGGTAFFFKQWGGRTPKAGGRELDGRTWDELPAAREVSHAA